jgi:endonuclease-3
LTNGNTLIVPAKATTAKERERAIQIYERLTAAYPDVRCTLDYRSPFQLLVMTILAAQCTDARVNIVCRELFRRYQSPHDFAASEQEELEAAVKTCGFFRQKAKSIRESSRIIVEQYGGSVPGTMEGLLALPGVGRKIANAVLGECFGMQGVIVDTHCRRVAGRLGFTKNTEPARIEKDLRRLWPPDRWTLLSHFMVFHGRAVCTARSPKCVTCCLVDVCPYPRKMAGLVGKNAEKKK